MGDRVLDHGPRAYMAKANSCGNSGIATTCPLPLLLQLQSVHFRFPGEKKNPASGEVFDRLPHHVMLGAVVGRLALPIWTPVKEATRRW